MIQFMEVIIDNTTNKVLIQVHQLFTHLWTNPRSPMALSCHGSWAFNLEEFLIFLYWFHDIDIWRVQVSCSEECSSMWVFLMEYRGSSAMRVSENQMKGMGSVWAVTSDATFILLVKGTNCQIPSL